MVDGQQRIVTLRLLFAAARERFLSHPDYQRLAIQLKRALQEVGGAAPCCYSQLRGLLQLSCLLQLPCLLHPP